MANRDCGVDDIRESNVPSDANVVFVHTGGLPAVFSCADELAKYRG